MSRPLRVRNHFGEEIILVDGSEVFELRTEREARRFLEELGDEAVDSVDARALPSGLRRDFEASASPEDRISVLAQLLSSGQFTVVRLERPFHPLEPIRSVRLADLIEPRPKVDSPPPTSITDEPALGEVGAVFDLLVIDRAGRPLFDALIEVRDPSGLARMLALSSQGHLRIDDLGSSGVCSVTLPPPHAMFLAPASAPLASVPSAEAEHFVELHPVEGGQLRLSTGVHHHLVVERPRIVRVETDCLTATPGSALLVPASSTEHRHPFEGVATALGHLAARPEAVLCVVGHAAPDEPRSSTTLAMQRALAMSSLLRDDRKLWVRTATEGGHYADVQAYLAYLANRRGWARDPGPITGEVDSRSTAGVKAFQREYNERFGKSILDDGICGEQTLGAIFDVLRFELERWFEKHGLTPDAVRLHPRTPALGAGVVYAGHPRFEGLAATRAHHIVDLVMFDPRAVDLDKDLEHAHIYEHPYADFELLDVVAEPGDWEKGTLTIVTDLPPEASDMAEVYRLFADDGSYDLDRLLGVDGRHAAGAIELDFEEVPVGPRLSLTATTEAGETFTVFAGLHFAELHPMSIEVEGDPPQGRR